MDEMEYVNTLVDGMDEENYAYALCQCPKPPTWGWKIPRSNEDRWVRFVCPDCGCKVGMFVRSKKGVE